MSHSAVTVVRLFPILVSLTWGCASFSSLPPQSAPFFVLEPSEMKTAHNLGRKQEALMAKCEETNSCDHAYFTRALAALFENRETAAKYFDKVIVASPRSQLAASSKLWLQLLQTTPSPSDLSWAEAVLAAPALSDNNAALIQVTHRLVRDLLDREVVIQQLRTVRETDSQAVEALQRELQDREKKLDALINKREPTRSAPETATVQSLQRQLNDRDKRIEELSSQLEALKRIDQEMREKIRPIKPPMSTPPVPSAEGKP